MHINIPTNEFYTLNVNNVSIISDTTQRVDGNVIVLKTNSIKLEKLELKDSPTDKNFLLGKVLFKINNIIYQNNDEISINSYYDFFVDYDKKRNSSAALHSADLKDVETNDPKIKELLIKAFSTIDIRSDAYISKI